VDVAPFDLKRLVSGAYSRTERVAVNGDTAIQQSSSIIDSAVQISHDRRETGRVASH